MPDADLPREIARRFRRGSSFGERKSRYNKGSRYDKGSRFRQRQPISGRSGTVAQEPAAGHRHDPGTLKIRAPALVGWVLISALAGAAVAPAPSLKCCSPRQKPFGSGTKRRQATRPLPSTARPSACGNGRVRSNPPPKRGSALDWLTNNLGSLDESLRSYKAALALVEGSSESLLESEIRSDLGVAQANAASRTSELEEARGQCERALALAKLAGGAAETGKALDCRGEVAYFLQDHAGALEFYREAGTVFTTLGHDVGKAQTQLHQGHVYSDLGRFDEAGACLDRAAALWAGIGDRRQQAIVRVAKARLEVRRGNYQKALNQFQEALTSLEPMGDAVWEGSGLTGIAWVYEEMAETGPALKHRERALKLFETAGLKIFAVEVLSNLGATYLASGDHTLALRHFERVLTLADELGIERWKVWALRFIGVVHLVRRLPGEALKYLDRAFEALPRIDDARLDRQLRADLGEAHDLLAHPDIARQYFDEALTRSRSAADRVTEARALFGLARNSSHANDLDSARSHIERALAVAESLRIGVDDRDLRASYVASVYGYYELQVDVLARLNVVRPGSGFSAKAFEASERARARSLLESLTESGIDLRAGVDPELLRREQTAKEAFDKWAEHSRQLNQDGKANTAQRLAGEYRDLEERYQQVQAEIRSRSPRFAALARPQPLSLREIQKEVLDRDTVLLKVLVGRSTKLPVGGIA